MRVFQRVLILELADDLLEDVLQGDDALDLSVLVHHHAQASLLLVEVQQLPLQRSALGNEVGFVAGRAQRLEGQLAMGQQMAD